MTWEIHTVQGGTVKRRLALTNDDGTVVQTNGWTWRAGISGSSGTVPVTVSVIQSGVIDVIVPATVTRALEPGVYTLAVDWTEPSGDTPEEEIKAVLWVGRDTAK